MTVGQHQPFYNDFFCVATAQSRPTLCSPSCLSPPPGIAITTFCNNLAENILQGKYLEIGNILRKIFSVVIFGTNANFAVLQILIKTLVVSGWGRGVCRPSLRPACKQCYLQSLISPLSLSLAVPHSLNRLQNPSITIAALLDNTKPISPLPGLVWWGEGAKYFIF